LGKTQSHFPFSKSTTNSNNIFTGLITPKQKYALKQGYFVRPKEFQTEVCQNLNYAKWGIYTLMDSQDTITALK